MSRLPRRWSCLPATGALLQVPAKQLSTPVSVSSPWLCQAGARLLSAGSPGSSDVQGLDVRVLPNATTSDVNSIRAAGQPATTVTPSSTNLGYEPMLGAKVGHSNAASTGASATTLASSSTGPEPTSAPTATSSSSQQYQQLNRQATSQDGSPTSTGSRLSCADGLGSTSSASSTCGARGSSTTTSTANGTAPSPTVVAMADLLNKARTKGEHSWSSLTSHVSATAGATALALRQARQALAQSAPAATSTPLAKDTGASSAESSGPAATAAAEVGSQTQGLAVGVRPAAGTTTSDISAAAWARVQRYATMLNELTGYSTVEKLKRAVVEADEKLSGKRQELQLRKSEYEALVDEQASLQKEMNGLLQRKNSWSETDVSRFTELFRSENRLETAVEAAQERFDKAADAVDAAQLALTRAIRERYTEEQMWADKIRRASTWWTWGLMGVQVLSFLGLLAVLEPRRAYLIRGQVEQLLKEREASQQEDLRAALQTHSQEVRQMLQETQLSPAAALSLALPGLSGPEAAGMAAEAVGAMPGTDPYPQQQPSAGSSSGMSLSLEAAIAHLLQDNQYMRRELHHMRTAMQASGEALGAVAQHLEASLILGQRQQQQAQAALDQLLLHLDGAGGGAALAAVRPAAEMQQQGTQADADGGEGAAEGEAFEPTAAGAIKRVWAGLGSSVTVTKKEAIAVGAACAVGGAVLSWVLLALTR